MPSIFDNIDQVLLTELKTTLTTATRADICVGYFNLRGWASIMEDVDHFTGAGQSCCRLLVGMGHTPEDEMRAAQSAIQTPDILGGDAKARLRHAAAQSFRTQIEFGVPSSLARATLRKLAEQIRAGKVKVKVYLGGNLHAKLYLFDTQFHNSPIVAYLGSSNLTMNGLSCQGELNVDVVERDAAEKLQTWFNARWNDQKLAFDISDELAELIENSWVQPRLLSPYHVYLKISYHLCEDARQGEREFRLPHDFQGVLLDFQTSAVSLAAHYLHQRGGVLLGDVVGLGKTLMASTIAKILQEDESSSALIICPPKLEKMWQGYVDRYHLAARVLSLGKVVDELPVMQTNYRLLIIDESHNLRNREGKRYKAIRQFIQQFEPRVLLLTATPYNKQYTDLSNQLRLIVDEDQDLRIRPEHFFRDWYKNGKSDNDFSAQYQTSTRSLRAFEQSSYPEDWRDLMRLFMVRRTRNFIIREYAKFDENKQRYYVTLNQQPRYFPLRQPRTVQFALDETNPNDQYARLFSEDVVKTIEELRLPRYGLGNYLVRTTTHQASPTEKRIIENLGKAGRRLIGFCRTNLFKRMESSGYSFLVSVERHILRNYVTLYALENHLPVPIGTQDASLLDTQVNDTDVDYSDEDSISETVPEDEFDPNRYEAETRESQYRQRAARVYQLYHTQYHARFTWLDAKYFSSNLAADLLADAASLIAVLKKARTWNADLDAKLAQLVLLLKSQHPNEKVLIFSQFSDTAAYLAEQLQQRGIQDLGLATADQDAVTLAHCFSPSTTGGLQPGENELRVLVATDVLAEGQNLQDAHIIVNYDLPWAIIRLIQRAGRVDRIGQTSDTIQVYSFLPADGVEAIIALRKRLVERLKQNNEVVGSDDLFFGDEAANQLRNLYTEKIGSLDDDRDEDVDLASLAMQVWNSSSESDREAALRLPTMASAGRSCQVSETADCADPGVIAYLRFPEGTDALVRIDEEGRLISQSLTSVFQDCACSPDTPALPLAANHDELVAAATRFAIQDQQDLAGQVGTLKNTAHKVINRLKIYRQTIQVQMPLLADQMLALLNPAMDALLTHPLTSSARDSLRRQLRLGISDEELAQLVIQLHQDGRLCTADNIQLSDPVIVCSLGLRSTAEESHA